MGTMTRPEARRMAVKLAKEGKKYHEIGPILHAQGFASGTTGKALTVGGVSALIAQSNKSGRTVRRPTTTTRRAHVTDKNDVIQAIAKLTSVAAEQRLALVELVAGL
jgi:hypothetical protein